MGAIFVTDFHLIFTPLSSACSNPCRAGMNQLTKKGLAEYGKFLAKGVFAVEKALFPC